MFILHNIIMTDLRYYFSNDENYYKLPEISSGNPPLYYTPLRNQSGSNCNSQSICFFKKSNL